MSALIYNEHTFRHYSASEFPAASSQRLHTSLQGVVESAYTLSLDGIKSVECLPVRNTARLKDNLYKL